MLQKIPIKKEYLLIGGTILIFWLSYQLAFKKMMEAWQMNKQLKSQLAQSADIGVQPAYLERKNHNLEEIINRYRADTIDFRNNIISTISVIAQNEGVKLSEVPLQDPLLHNEHFILQKLSFEGAYIPLMKTLNKLLVTSDLGIIRSVKIEYRKDDRGGHFSGKLVMQVFFAMIKN